VLEELGNLHSKTMKGFKKKMKTMKKSLKGMAAQIKDFLNKPRPPSPTPEVRRPVPQARLQGGPKGSINLELHYLSLGKYLRVERAKE